MGVAPDYLAPSLACTRYVCRLRSLRLYVFAFNNEKHFSHEIHNNRKVFSTGAIIFIR